MLMLSLTVKKLCQKPGPDYRTWARAIATKMTSANSKKNPSAQLSHTYAAIIIYTSTPLDALISDKIARFTRGLRCD